MQAEGDSPKMQQSRDLAGKSCRAMEFGKKKKSQAYPIRLQLYKTPPVDIISLQEFEELALQRLKREGSSVSQLSCMFLLVCEHRLMDDHQLTNPKPDCLPCIASL